MDDSLIQKAKRYSRRTGKSVSQLVADYFAVLEMPESPGDLSISARVQALVGVLGDGAVDEEDYRRHLQEKHR